MERGEKKLRDQLFEGARYTYYGLFMASFQGAIHYDYFKAITLVRIHGGLETTENSETRVLIWYRIY